MRPVKLIIEDTYSKLSKLRRITKYILVYFYLFSMIKCPVIWLIGGDGKHATLSLWRGPVRVRYGSPYGIVAQWERRCFASIRFGVRAPAVPPVK